MKPNATPEERREWLDESRAWVAGARKNLETVEKMERWRPYAVAGMWIGILMCVVSVFL